MRDIRAIRYEKTAADVMDQGQDQGDAPGGGRNLLPEQQHLPAYYQALRQHGQVSMDGVFAILRDLASRMDAAEGAEDKLQGPAPSQNENDTQE